MKDEIEEKLMKEIELERIRKKIIGNKELAKIWCKEIFNFHQKKRGQFTSLIWRVFELGKLETKKAEREKFKEIIKKARLTFSGIGKGEEEHNVVSLELIEDFIDKELKKQLQEDTLEVGE